MQQCSQTKAGPETELFPMQPRRFFISNISNKDIVFSLFPLSRLQYFCLFAFYTHTIYSDLKIWSNLNNRNLCSVNCWLSDQQRCRKTRLRYFEVNKRFFQPLFSRVWVQQSLRAQPPPQRALAWKQLRLSSALVWCNNLSGWCQWTSMGLNFPAVTTIITSVLHVLASTWCTSYCCMGPSHHTNWTIVLLVHCVICASSFACLDVQSVWT